MAYIKLSKEAFLHNINIFTQKLGSTKKIMAVLKDNAYGHGIEQMALLCSKVGIKRAVVKDTNEALKIKELFDKILILIDHDTKAFLADERLVYSLSSKEAIMSISPKVQVYIKLDSGMRRNGVKYFELREVMQKAHERGIKILGLFTHYHSADILNNSFFLQVEEYKKAKILAQKIADELNMGKLEFHSSATAAFLRGKIYTEDDFIRLGIGMYGYNPLEKCFGEYNLRPVLSLWAKKLNSRELKKGECLGYGGRFIAPKDMQISTYDLGYGDGLMRGDGIRSYPLAKGKLALGVVSMDCLSVECLDDEICIFDDARILANKFDTIVYEILVKLMPYIKRIIV